MANGKLRGRCIRAVHHLVSRSWFDIGHGLRSAITPVAISVKETQA
jgi:hypothetical protein